MLKKAKYIIIPIIVVVSFGFIGSNQDLYFKISKSIDIFGRVYKEISINYVDEINPEEFMISGIKGMLGSLDPYTVYIDENLQKDVDIITKGKYGGIGATIGLREDKVTVVDLLEGYSAQRQGIMIGDVITHIDGIKVDRSNYDEISSLIKGDLGTDIDLKILRDGEKETLTFVLVREEIEIKNLTYAGFYPEDSDNVYLKLSGFTRSAGKEIGDALKKLNEQKTVKSIILDLRGNPGGLLDAAIDVSEKFLNKDQLVVSVKGRDNIGETKYFAKEQPLAMQSNLIVLVDEGSASASEIVAGAIQDHDRGVILGTTSFGKGLVQTLVPLSYNTSLKITTAKYYTPSGRCIQKVDYSENNKVFDSSGTNAKLEYETDNKRMVTSAGGIVPDTIVTNGSESSQIKNLLAKGMFFKFATHYFNSHKETSINEFSNENLFNEFETYLNDQEYNYTSESERLVDKLKEISKEEDIYTSLSSQISELEAIIGKIKSDEMDKYKSDIIIEIKKELAARIDGRNGRIIESLKYDNQFDVALKILNNEPIYSGLLNFD
ncbi:MAG: S41 family peptidase [Ignavibacteria bacterium]